MLTEESMGALFLLCQDIEHLVDTPLSIMTGLGHTSGCKDKKPTKWCNNRKKKCKKASIYQKCKKTCDKCDEKPKCKDKGKKVCNKIKDKCNKANVMKKCPKTCGKCGGTGRTLLISATIHHYVVSK